MGSSESTMSTNIEGGSEGYHVLKVTPGSPGHRAGVQPYFDFIIFIGNTRLNQDNETFKEILKSSIGRETKLTLFNSKTGKIRDVLVVPSTEWGGQGLLGISIRFCSFDKANENVWHILEVEDNSPAQKSGLQSNCDYIIGADSLLQESEDLFSLIEAHEGKPLKLFVYNILTDEVREVSITPNSNWGGEGMLGCGIGYGYLHRIPTRPLDEVTHQILADSTIEPGVAASEHPPVQIYDSLPSYKANPHAPPQRPEYQENPPAQTSVPYSIPSQQSMQTQLPLGNQPVHQPQTLQQQLTAQLQKGPVPVFASNPPPRQFFVPSPQLNNYASSGDMNQQTPQLYNFQQEQRSYSQNTNIDQSLSQQHENQEIKHSFPYQTMQQPFSLSTPLTIPGMPPLTVTASLPTEIKLASLPGINYTNPPPPPPSSAINLGAPATSVTTSRI